MTHKLTLRCLLVIFQLVLSGCFLEQNSEMKLMRGKCVSNRKQQSHLLIRLTMHIGALVLPLVSKHFSTREIAFTVTRHVRAVRALIQ